MEAIINVLPHGLDLLLDKDVTKAHEAIQSATSSGGGHHHKGHNCVHRHDAAGHPSQTGRTVPLGTPGKCHRL
jgi:gephyrin